MVCEVKPEMCGQAEHGPRQSNFENREIYTQVLLEVNFLYFVLGNHDTVGN